MATLPDIVPHINLQTSRLPLYLSAGAVSLTLLAVIKSISSSLTSDFPKIIASPRETLLPNLSQGEIDSLPYPPDVLPGARDVDSPYGCIRVYEWGPDDGRKVLMLHGISTPSIALAGLAHKLVEKGCRVMLFDLFGRGYSSSPSPSSIPFDSRLYTTQILLCLTSSRLHWSHFSLIGYSLGGALAADFTSYFPLLVSSLILIAPGGLIRTSHITWKSRLLYSTSGLLPQWLIERLVAKRLHTGPPSTHSIEPEPTLSLSSDEGKADKKGGLRSRSIYTSSHAPLIPSHPPSTVGAVVDAQIAHHAGFVPAFISSIQHAPIHEQHARWRVIGSRLASQAANPMVPGFQMLGLERGMVLMLLGEWDPIVLADEVAEDARVVLGEGGLRVEILAAGHEVPIERVEECVKVIWGFWGGE
ncbi:alpha/beta-hydrolase [Lepidopterella palustris CBS 459.81]|uniref:Alpha/beta-hydrolase n=1 Tax=Lepidopterella palustris CBS 459.81 TaxID=1314670 RepID=A0A8E2EDC9_9PEZI|nr:alpha/beta-hydrolase [Lepidopterella palustris CBS 459.81]